MSGLSVGIVGCGLIGTKRAVALPPQDHVVACHDIDPAAARGLAKKLGCESCSSMSGLLERAPDVVVVATTHDQLAGLAELALQRGSHVLVEKPAGVSVSQVDRLIERARDAGRIVKVGFNHRFHEAIERAAAEAHSGRHGEAMYLRARYGHGGRPGYEREWRTHPQRSGGGELIDQGMHLLDLSHWLMGPLPLHSALLRTQFWDAPVEDNAALILGRLDSTTEPWAMLHVSWTEWKNLFSLEVYCRTAKIQVDGLVRSYGPQRLTIYRMAPEMGPPAVEETVYPDEDRSWQREWMNLTEAISAGDASLLNGDLGDARYAWQQVEAAYATGPYSRMRAAAVI